MPLAPDVLDAVVRTLLRDRVQDFDALEVLMLLSGEPTRTWTAAEVARQLTIKPAVAEAALVELGRRGLAGAPAELGRFIFQPDSPETADAVERLARAYRSARLDVMKAMSDNAIARMRTKTMHLFADAFVVGSKKDG